MSNFMISTDADDSVQYAVRVSLDCTGQTRWHRDGVWDILEKSPRCSQEGMSYLRKSLPLLIVITSNTRKNVKL